MRNLPRTIIDRLKSLVRMGEMETAVFLSIFPDIPSGPEALLVSIARSRVNTSSSVQRIFSGGIVAKSARNFWESFSVREGTAELKLREKTSLRQAALSVFHFITSEPFFKVGI